MNKSSKNWLTLGVLVIIAVVIIALISISGPAKPSPSATASGEATLTLVGPSGGSVEVGDIQHVSWTSENYVPSTVGVRVIRQVSSNPARYELVRTVAVATVNDGDAVWVPAKKDAGTNTFIEVACAFSPQGCHASKPAAALAVIDNGRFANTANAFEAIEQSNNQ